MLKCFEASLTNNIDPNLNAPVGSTLFVEETKRKKKQMPFVIGALKVKKCVILGPSPNLRYLHSQSLDVGGD